MIANDSWNNGFIQMVFCGANAFRMPDLGEIDKGERKYNNELLSCVPNRESNVNTNPKSTPHQQWRKFYLCSLLE